MKIAIQTILLMLLFMVVSCRKANTGANAILPPSTIGVYIVNEGGFSGGASLSYFDKTRDSLYQNILGSSVSWAFPNDMLIQGTKGYVTINGSDRIDVVDITANTVIKSIALPQFTGPGYLAADGARMFVASYNGSVSSIGIANDSLLVTLNSVVTFPGGIAQLAGKVFVSDYGTYVGGTFVPGRYIKVINASTMQVVDSIRVSEAPGAMTVSSGRVFAVCVGTATVAPRIYQITPDHDQIEDSLQISGSVSDIATDGHSLFVLSSNSVAKYDIGPLRLLSPMIVARATGNYYYALAIDGSNGDIYVSNIISTGGSGQIEIYTPLGVPRRLPIVSGIFPGAFAFKTEM
jgi:hypothetical protein